MLWFSGLAAASMVACSHKSDPAPDAPKPLTQAELMDPTSCSTCHATHFRQWAGSMHAYAAEDPLFLAMNARGQRETKGALGTFCVKCHAPVAVQLGTTTDGTNLASLPSWQKGVTCYFCHSAQSVSDTHDASLVFGKDAFLRGPITDEAGASPHTVQYSALHDSKKAASASLCGSCHDIQNGAGVHLARTYEEWRGTLFAHDEPGKLLTCGACHMPGRDDRIAPDGPIRRAHDHTMPGVDVALTAFAGTDEQKTAVQANLDPSLVSKLCIKPKAGGFQVEYSLDDAFAGHGFPSGAAYHRRAWAEVTAWSAGAIVFHSGDVPADKAASTIASSDATMWLLGDQLTDDAGKPTEMLWNAAKFTSSQLPPAVTNDPKNPAYYHAVIRTYDMPPVSLDKVRAEVHIRPVDLDFIDDLIASGDLDASYRAKLNTFTLGGSVLEWTKDLGPICIPK